MVKPFHITLLVFVFISAALIGNIVATTNYLLGAYYGLDGDNLPPSPVVMQLCRKYNISKIRLSEPNIDVLYALRGMGIEVSFSMSNNELKNMSTNNTAVEEWFNTYIQPFISDININYIIIGDKAIPGLDAYILPVMISLRKILNSKFLEQVKLTTLVGYNQVLAKKDPPSAGVFDPTIADNMREILIFLSRTGSPLMISIDPYRKYLYGNNISLNYAIFQSSESVIYPGAPLRYFNLFDEMVDAFYAAIEKTGMQIPLIDVAIGETGWPTCGDDAATTALAQIYNQNMLRHVLSGKGTPKKPHVFMETFVQSLFNENQKPDGDSQCFGFFNTNLTPIYPLSF